MLQKPKDLLRHIDAAGILRRYRPELALFGVTCLYLAIMVLSTRVAVVHSGDAVEVFRTLDNDPYSIAQGSMFALGLEDDVTVNSKTPYFIDISINEAFDVKVSVDGTTHTVETTGDTVYSLLQKAGVTLYDGDQLNYRLDCPVFKDMEVDIARVSYEIVTEEMPIPYDVRRVASQNVPVGSFVETTAGKEGLAVSTLEHKYLNGNLVDTRILEEEVIKKPVTGVVAYGVGGTVSTSRSDATRYSFYLDMTATAYTYGEGGQWGDVTRSGKAVQVGYVAVDPKVIPLGSRLYITYPNGRVAYGFAVAEDTGGAIKGARIDLFFESREECISFGRRKVRVYVLE